MFELSVFFRSEQILKAGAFQRLDTCTAEQPGSLAYCVDLRYLHQAQKNPNVSAIILTAALAAQLDDQYPQGIVLSATPRETYWELHNRLCHEQLIGMGITEQQIGAQCQIHSSAVIGTRVKIGDHVTIGAGVIIDDNSLIGDGVVLAAGVVIGTSGLQTYHHHGRQSTIIHAGGVRLGEAVTVLANSVVSKAVFPIFTEVGNNTAVSILCSIGHQSKLGANCALAGNVLVGGSVIMGNNVWVGPSATIKDGITIGENAQIKLGSVVVKPVAAGEVVSGNFAIDHRLNLRDQARKRR